MKPKPKIYIVILLSFFQNATFPFVTFQFCSSKLFILNSSSMRRRWLNCYYPPLDENNIQRPRISYLQRPPTHNELPMHHKSPWQESCDKHCAANTSAYINVSIPFLLSPCVCQRFIFHPVLALVCWNKSHIFFNDNRYSGQFTCTSTNFTGF